MDHLAMARFFDPESERAKARWLAAEKVALAQRDEEIGHKSARESRFNAIVDIVARSKTFNRGYYPGAAPRDLDAQLHNDAQHDGIIHSGLSFEPSKPVLEQPILDHFSSPAVVGTSQGKARTGAMKDALSSPRSDAATVTSPFPQPGAPPMRKLLDACRRLDDHWAGDLIGVACLFSLIPIVLFLGSIIEGGQ